MGRALFSQAYAVPSPAVRTEPEPKVDICERWTSWSHFDPDSEDFFQDAEYEAFIDPVQVAREQAELASLARADGTADSSDSSDSSISDRGSPMAVGSDDPAILIADVYTNRTARWEVDSEVTSPTEPEWRPARATRSIARAFTVPPFVTSESPRRDQLTNPVFIPPAIAPDASATDAPVSPTLRRTVNITPINVTRTPQVEAEDRSPSPDSPAPSTPPPQSTLTFRRQSQTMITPSPPPSVTPRFYSWQQHSFPALPSSPTLAHTNRDGPLTNPRARMSFARIDASPARIRIPNTVM
ncbi:hypothetical protein BDZ97DRAFT_1903322 [Flammula alnicola]|nr:hypothetical protein BDZ97DRAFT_1903322 [Flammula alnicola]